MQTTFKKLISLTILTVISLTFFSCKKNDADEMQEAQYCLNKAADSGARACVSKIASMGTPAAYKLMCASVFISKGFGSVSSFASAIDQITHPSAGSGCSGADCSGSLNAMNIMNFGTDATAADEAVNFCTKSSVVAYAQMSSMFSIGTQLKIQLGSADPNAANLEAAAAAMPPATVGAIVNATYAASCSDLSNASNETKKYCAQMQVAVANTDGSNAAVGAFLQNCFANPGTGSCP